ncbi:MAG: hypothetical protein KAT46_04560 [Deltaproteobacteria bacterium]|nr:hypothetical protein [Deltaproteobacteria bacterium]
MSNQEDGGHSHDDFCEVTVTLEAEHLDLIQEVADEYAEKLGKGWDFSAIVRVAVGDLLTKLGKMS